jgi:FtsH-binding integral membrane protein
VTRAMPHMKGLGRGTPMHDRLDRQSSLRTAMAWAGWSVLVSAGAMVLLTVVRTARSSEPANKSLLWGAVPIALLICGFSLALRRATRRNTMTRGIIWWVIATVVFVLAPTWLWMMNI